MCRMTFAAAAAPSARVEALVVTHPMPAQKLPERAVSAQLGTMVYRLGERLTGGVQFLLTTVFR